MEAFYFSVGKGKGILTYLRDKLSSEVVQIEWRYQLVWPSFHICIEELVHPAL